VDEFKKDTNLLNGKGENDVEWITVNGSHIPIEDGESPQEAIEKRFKNSGRKNEYIVLPKEEYAGLCSAIRTKYANKIPKSGSMLYKNNYYWYNYNKNTMEITCSLKICIEGNEDLIEYLEGANGK
jgi:hypothetical protein